MKFTCPHCGEKTFSPLLKARCGGMSSAGKNCPSCGGRCVNGKLSLFVHTMLTMTAMIMIFYTYFTHTTLMQVFWFGLVPLVLAYVIGFVFDMVCGSLIAAIKRE